MILPMLTVGLAMLTGACGRDLDLPTSTSAARVPAVPPVASCTQDDLRVAAVQPDVAAQHAIAPPPVLVYPVGSSPPPMWGVSVSMRVDRAGRVACYALHDAAGQDVPITPERRQLIDQLGTWRFRPFQLDGQPVDALVPIHVREQETPAQHVDGPSVSPAQVTIVMDRSACYGRCPSYRVELRGDGTIRWTGHGDVDVMGEQTDRIPAARVAALWAKARALDLWSMRDAYSGGITDMPSTRLELITPTGSKTIHDYAGALDGMPAAVNEFEDAVDEAAGSAGRIRIDGAHLARRLQAGLDPRSLEAGVLLRRLLETPAPHDDAALAALVRAGAPLDADAPSVARGEKAHLLQLAQFHRDAATVDALLLREPLDASRAGRKRLDAAFQAAIYNSDFAGVQRFWNAVPGLRPSTRAVSESHEFGREVRRTVPVTLLIERWPGLAHWEGKAIAEWLAAQGVSLKARTANGDTLLHRAVQARDVEFCRFLLARGLDPSTPGGYGLPALASADNEDIAMLLLENGADFRSPGARDWHFADYARDRHWTRVLAWFAAHRPG